MIIFIDESGDPGFKIQSGSSKFFVLILVIFDNELNAQNASDRIKKFKSDMKKSSKYENKFNKLEKFERILFLEEIKHCRFSIRGLIVDKETISPTNLSKDNNLYYNFFLKQLLEHNKLIIKDAKIHLDGASKRKFKKTTTSYLRQGLRKNKKIKSIKFVNSKNDDLIQLADMVAGSIRRHYEGEKNDSKIYRDIIIKFINDEWIFDKKAI